MEEEDCALSNIYPGDFQQKWPLHVTKNLWSRIQVTYYENKSTISDIPLHFHHINKDATIISLCVLRKVLFATILTLPFSHILSKIRILFQKKKMGTEATFIIFSSYDRRMCLLHTDTDMVISHVTYSVIITSILTLLIICLWHRLYCSLSKQNGVSKQLGVAQVLKPPSFCCLYFAFTGNQCLYSACV